MLLTGLFRLFHLDQQSDPKFNGLTVRLGAWASIVDCHEELKYEENLRSAGLVIAKGAAGLVPILE